MRKYVYPPPEHFPSPFPALVFCIDVYLSDGHTINECLFIFLSSMEGRIHLLIKEISKITRRGTVWWAPCTRLPDSAVINILPILFYLFPLLVFPPPLWILKANLRCRSISPIHISICISSGSEHILPHNHHTIKISPKNNSSSLGQLLPFL